MHQSKLIILLRTLDRRELREFEVFLKGMHSKKTNVILVFDYIKKYHPTYNSEKLKLEYLFSKIFKSESFNYRKITDSIYKLYSIVKEFLVWDHLKNSRFQLDYFMMKVYRKKKLHQDFFRTGEQLLKKLDRNPFSTWHYLQKIQVYDLLYYHDDLGKIEGNSEMLGKALTNLDSFYFLTQMRFGCEIINRMGILNEHDQEGIAFLEKISKISPLISSQEDINILNIYKLVFNLISRKDYGAFFELKYILANTDIDRDYFTQIHAYLLNFTASQIRQGRTEFLRETFDLYKLGISFFKDDLIPATRFTNIVTTACALGKFDWADNFIVKFKDRLDTNQKHDILKIALATISFEKKNFSEVLTILSNAKFINPFYSLRAKSLMLLCFYELKEDSNLIFDYCRSFDMYLRRNKVLNKRTLQSYTNLVKIVKKLILLNVDSYKEISYDLSQVSFIAHKKWIIEKLSISE